MIDIHCHILPGVDDGAKDMDETIKMARVAESENIKSIIATPHYIEYNDYLNKTQLKEVVDAVNETLKEQNIDLTITLGHEVYVTPNLVQLVKDGEVATLNDSRYLLLEFPMNDIPNYAEDLIYELTLMDIVPIIAHPERYSQIIEDPNRLHDFIKLGALCQSNTGSINGLFGQNVQETVWTLMKHQLIHFVATDAHTSRQRAPLMQKAFNAVSEYDQQLATELFIDNPAKIYANETIIAKEPLEIQKKTMMDKLMGLFKRD